MNDLVRAAKLLLAATMMAALAVAAGVPAAAATEDAVLDELVAYEKSLNDPWFKNDINAWVASINDETTYFDPTAGRKLVGEEVREFFRTVYGGNFPPGLDYELTDTSAVVRGDVAVFTCHMDMFVSASGEPAGRWMVTKVFERTDDGWQTIHAHLSMPAPPPEEAPEA
jgi:hypothetical protein